MTTKPESKFVRLQLRVTKAQKEMLQRAAAIAGKSLNAFIVESALNAANIIIAEAEKTATP